MGIKLLLADDNTIMRGYLEKFLGKIKDISKIVAVDDGQKALTEAQKISPDVILLDVEMPVMDGLTALREIKTLQKSGKINPKAKVIILSGTMHENDANVRKAKFLGADHVFSKPGGKDMSYSIDAEGLINAIRDCVPSK